MTPLYTANATATSGRDGKVFTDDKSFELGLAMPRGLGGPGGAGTNPEQLFAAGYAACFGSALKLVAMQQKVVTGPVVINAKVHIGRTDKGFGLAVELQGVMPELPKEKAEALMHAAYGVCPYSNATRGNIEVTLSVA
jgi:Ohr subfamily peroxiredoxin